MFLHLLRRVTMNLLHLHYEVAMMIMIMMIMMTMMTIFSGINSLIVISNY